LDLGAYDKFFSKELKDYALPTSEIEKALKDLPKVK